MKVLLLTFGNILSPQNGYLIRVSMVYNCLLKEHKVKVVQFVSDKFSNSTTDNLNIFSIKIYNNYLFNSIKILYKALTSVNLIKDSDIVMVEGSIFLPFIIISKIFGKKVIYDTHGSIVEVSKTLKGIKNFILRRVIGGLLDSLSTKLSDIVIAISEKDADIFKKYTSKKDKVVVVRHGIDVEKIPFYATNNKSIKKVIFVGNLRSVQNYEAVKVIIDIARKVKDVEFLIVGEGKELFNDYPSNVRFFGKVESLDEYYKQADACFIPLTTGTGIKTKVLECMAYGKPIITTEKGIEGLVGIEKLKGVYVSTIDNLPKILSNIKLDEDYIELRKYVEENYSFTASCRSLLNLISQRLASV